MIDSALTEKECAKLGELSKACQGAIVEIGSYKGRSTIAMAKVSMDKTVYAIDLWDMRYYDFSPSPKVAERGFYLAKTFKEFMYNMQVAGTTNVIPVKGDSHEIGKVWNIPIGLLFIDGDHSYKSVLMDYLLYSKHLIKGGYIAFHDHVLEPIARVIHEKVKPEFTDYELTDTLWTAKKR